MDISWVIWCFFTSFQDSQNGANNHHERSVRPRTDGFRLTSAGGGVTTEEEQRAKENNDIEVILYFFIVVFIYY